VSILQIVARIEQERALNQTLLDRLIEGLDADIRAIEEKKQNLREEFAERDVSLLRLIEGEQPMAVPAVVPATPAITGHSDDAADLAA
jgi:hypothetical protein